MKGQGKRKGRREEVKMEQRKEEGECRGTSLYKPMPVVLFALILIAAMIPLSQAEQQQIVEIWNKTWGSNYKGSPLYDSPKIAIDSHGYIYVTGHIDKGENEGHIFLSKYAPDGNLIWRVIGFEGRSFGVAIDSSGYIYVTASSSLSKYDPDGNLIWCKQLDGNGGVVNGFGGVAIDSSDNIYVAGIFYNYTTRDVDAALLKFKPEGGLVWIRKEFWGEGAQAYGVAVDSSGYIYVTGFSFNGYRVTRLSKFSSEGTLIWDRIWNINSEGYDVAVNSGYVYVIGRTFDYGGAFLLKFNSFGDLIWDRRYNDSSGYCGITVDSGCIYVTGGSANDVLISKYDLNGNLICSKTWGDGYDDIGYQIAVDSACIYVTGLIGSYGDNMSAFLLKLGDLVEKYKPIFIFHHEEEYLPVAFDAMIDQGFVINPDDNITVDYGDKKVKYAKIVEANPSPDRLDDPDINKESYQLTFDPDIKSEYEIVDYTPVEASWKAWPFDKPMTPEDIITQVSEYK